MISLIIFYPAAAAANHPELGCRGMRNVALRRGETGHWTAGNTTATNPGTCCLLDLGLWAGIKTSAVNYLVLVRGEMSFVGRRKI